MQNLLKCSQILAVIAVFVGSQAHALFDARLTYGLLASQPDLSKMYSTPSISNPSVAPTYGIGADVLVSPPLIDFGFGLRYENMGVKASNGTLEFKGTNTRTALLVDYRFINTLLLIGIIGSYGLSHTGKFTVQESLSGTDQDWSADNVTSYSIGAEVGAKLLGFQVGAEVGYENLKWNKMTDKNSSSTASIDLDMAGSYTKLFVGFGF